ncbi:hypothetical protein, partial [Acidiphilium sp.]|uniref:hypothetical protein n=1 Tax=Acidiphilium sp. TaxID=527 RepID=UPI003CFCBCB5
MTTLKYGILAAGLVALPVGAWAATAGGATPAFQPLAAARPVAAAQATVAGARTLPIAFTTVAFTPVA